MRFSARDEDEAPAPSTTSSKKEFLTVVRSLSSLSIKPATVKYSPQNTRQYSVHLEPSKPLIKNMLKEQQDLFEKSIRERQSRSKTVIAALAKKNLDMKALVEKSIKDVDILNEKYAKELLLRNEEIKRQELLKREEEALQIEKAHAQKLKDDQERAIAQKAKEDQQKLELQKLKDEQAKVQAQRLKDEQEKLVREASTPKASVSENAQNEASALLEKIMHIKTVLKPALKKDAKLSMSFIKYKMAVKVSIGQMTKSRQKLFDIAISVNQKLENAKNVSNDFALLVMDMTAKSIIKQAETEVSVKLDMAFPLAAICVLLFGKYADFLPILLGRLIKQCPYIVPKYTEREPNEAIDSFKKRQGYLQVEEGVYESEIQYSERMCGILALYAAIVQTKNAKVPLYTIKHGWIWISRILNMPPRKITPQLLMVFLQIAGNEFLKSYKKQAEKLIHYIIDNVIPNLDKESVASNTRLKLFIEETVLSKNDIPIYPNSQILQ